MGADKNVQPLQESEPCVDPCLHLHLLASGSKGNAYVVEGPANSLLIDDGLSLRELKRRAAELSVNLSRITACLVTHEHSDHTKGLPVLAKHFDGTLYASCGTAASRPSMEQLGFATFDAGSTLTLGCMEVATFSTSHDVCDPVGLSIRCGDDSVGICTDTGYMTPAALEALSDLGILALESNHDERMLASGPYPGYLKQRVSGPLGHLSNSQAAQAAAQLVGSHTRAVVAMHLSQENNRPSLAVGALAEALGATVANDVGTQAATPNGRLAIVAAGQARPMTVR